MATAQASTPSFSHRTFLTNNTGIKVSLTTDDTIIEIPADCIFCYVDEKMDDELSKGIALGSSNSLQECRSLFLEQKKSVQATKVLTRNGGERWQKVVYAFGPVWSDDYDQGKKDQYGERLTETIYNCLLEVHKLGLRTVVLPFFRSVPAENGASCYVAALVKFDCCERPEVAGFEKGKTSLEHIMLVSDDTSRISSLYRHARESKDLTEDKQDVLRIVLIGKTGMGKSETGNSILGQNYFTVGQQFKPVTGKSSLGNKDHHGCNIQVVDTPGLFEETSDSDKEDIIREILKSVLFTLPGPHVFILVFRGDTRFDKDEKEIAIKMKQIFFKEFVRFAMIVFTHVDPGKVPDLLREAPDSLKNLVKECNGRAVGIDNSLKILPEEDEDEEEEFKERKRKKREKKLEGQVDAIIKKAMEVREETRAKASARRGGPVVDYYQNKLTARCLQLLLTSPGGRSVDQIIKAVERGDDELSMRIDRMKDDVRRGDESKVIKLTEDPKARSEASSSCC